MPVTFYRKRNEMKIERFENIDTCKEAGQLMIFQDSTGNLLYERILMITMIR